MVEEGLRGDAIRGCRKKKKEKRLYTDKNENKTFLIYKEIQSGAVAKLYIYEEGLPNTVYEEILCKYFTIYDFATAPF